MSNAPHRRSAPWPRPRLNGHRRPPAAGRHGAASDVAMCYGMTFTDAPDEIEQAKQATHDQLIGMLGDRRRGPVYWRIIPSAEVPATLNKLAEGGQAHYEGEVSRDDGFANMRRHLLEHPDAVLVIAQAAAVTK